jgi:hypothetical protein
MMAEIQTCDACDTFHVGRCPQTITMHDADTGVSEVMEVILSYPTDITVVEDEPATTSRDTTVPTSWRFWNDTHPPHPDVVWNYDISPHDNDYNWRLTFGMLRVLNGHRPSTKGRFPQWFLDYDRDTYGPSPTSSPRPKVFAVTAAVWDAFHSQRNMRIHRLAGPMKDAPFGSHHSGSDVKLEGTIKYERAKKEAEDQKTYHSGSEVKLEGTIKYGRAKKEAEDQKTYFKKEY